MSRLWVRLTLAFLLISLAAISVVAVLSLNATNNQFRRYVVSSGSGSQPGAVAALTGFYAQSGSWAGVDNLLDQLTPGAGGRGRVDQGQAGPNFAIAGTDGRVIASRTGELVGELLSPEELGQGTPLTVDGEPVGVLLNLRSAEAVLDTHAQMFLQQVQASLVWAALGAAVLSLVLGFATSRLLTAPIARLTAAAEAIAAGDLSQRVDVRSRDETGVLGQAFNDMAASLAAAETARKNLIAEVSHELRTPLTVVQGNLQAILDGVYPLEMAQVTGLYEETRLLTRLVDDLHDLALADAGQLRLERSAIDMGEIARGAVAQFGPVAEAGGVSLRLSLPEERSAVVGDSDRLAQVLRNLLSNALRHTPAGGEVAVVVRVTGDRVQLVVRDTGSGISPADLPHVFDRFYRGDRSRSRQGGGAGLGLAIARQLVRAHAGELTVESSPGTGTTFTMTLPLHAASELA